MLDGECLEQPFSKSSHRGLGSVGHPWNKLSEDVNTNARSFSRTTASFPLHGADSTRSGTRANDPMHTKGHGDTNLTFRKTGNAMFFCATNPDPNANGCVGIAAEWNHTEDGRSAGKGESWGTARVYRSLESWGLGKGCKCGVTHSHELPATS